MLLLFIFFFLNDTATTEIYTYSHPLSLPDALPISWPRRSRPQRPSAGRWRGSCALSLRTDTDHPHHPGMHVVEEVAVEGPIAHRIRGEIPCHLAARLDDDRVLARGMVAMTGDKLEEVAVDMDRMAHHSRSEEHTSELQSLMRIPY